jgi:hypothetical protein
VGAEIKSSASNLSNSGEERTEPHRNHYAPNYRQWLLIFEHIYENYYGIALNQRRRLSASKPSPPAGVTKAKPEQANSPLATEPHYRGKSTSDFPCIPLTVSPWRSN